MKRYVFWIMLMGLVLASPGFLAVAQEEIEKQEEFRKQKELQKLEILEELKGLEDFLELHQGLQELEGIRELEETLEDLEIDDGAYQQAMKAFDRAAVEQRSQSIQFHAQQLKALLDLEAMEEEVSDLIDLTAKEQKRVRGFLKAMRNQWVKENEGGLHIDMKDKAWFRDLTEEVEETLEADKAEPFIDWMEDRRRAVEDCARELEKSAARLGAEMGQWAQRFSGTLAKDIQKNARKYEALAQRYAKDWEKMARSLSRDMTDFSRKASRDYAKIAQDLARSIQLQIGDSLDKEALKNLQNLSRLGETDWDDFGDRINKIVEHSVQGIKTMDLDNERFRESMERYAESVSEASEMLQQALENKRFEMDKSFQGNWRAFGEALRELGETNAFELKDEEKVLREIKEKAERGKLEIIDEELLEKIRDLKKDKARAQQMKERAELLRQEAAQKAYIKQLQEEKASIRSRDKEMLELRKQIQALKEEIRALKEELDQQQRLMM